MGGRCHKWVLETDHLTQELQNQQMIVLVGIKEFLSGKPLYMLVKETNTSLILVGHFLNGRKTGATVWEDTHKLGIVDRLLLIMGQRVADKGE